MCKILDVRGLPVTYQTEEWISFNKDFERMLGVTEFSEFNDRPVHLDTPMPEQLKELLIALVGPNSKFHLKVHQARCGMLEGT